ncbi:hypothetical protein DID88_005215 [Monilinia fructigena]|uniref:Uncharacterized protein n=1 Tax=Monilinia fructigena TaxID=38457 RepID=A0A395IG77_9HELO|nr:hypothetical protein DID88_005215 [Monilinia fructigena]
MLPSYLHGIAIDFIRSKEENASNLKSFRVTLRMMLSYIDKNDVVGKEKNVDDVYMHASPVTRQVSRPCTAIKIAIENVDDAVFELLILLRHIEI